MILGVDRADYTKGLLNRFKAFERLLSDYPEFLGKVMLFQVAVPSRTDVREYQELKEKMDKLVGQINGRFSTHCWSPIRYIYGCLTQAELAGFYRDADVGLVTPLRDGMNLVAKEFVACRTREPGVLILSPFAGAGGMMQEALLVNPYEVGNVARMLARALKMPREEREVRMNALRNREKIHDVDFWLKSFLKSIGTLIEEEGEWEYTIHDYYDNTIFYLKARMFYRHRCSQSSWRTLTAAWGATLVPRAGWLSCWTMTAPSVLSPHTPTSPPSPLTPSRSSRGQQFAWRQSLYDISP